MRYLELFEETCMVVSLIVIVVLVCTQVILRYVFKTGIVWNDEAVGFLFVVMGMVGSAVAIREKMHPGIQLALDKSPRWLAVILKTLGNVAIVGFLLVFLVSGVDLTRSNTTQVSPMLRIPMAIPYAVLPLSAVIMLVEFLRLLLKGLARPVPAGLRAARSRRQQGR